MADPWKSRPLLMVAVGLGAGMSAPFFAYAPLLLLLPLLMSRRWATVAMLVPAYLVGAFLAPGPAVKPVHEERYARKTVDIVSLPQTTTDGYSFIGSSGAERFLVTTRQRWDVSWGDRVELSGWIAPLGEAAERRMTQQGISAQLKTSMEPEVAERGAYIWRLGLAVRSNFLAYSDRLLNSERSALLDAMCFNHRGDLDLDTSQAFQRSGLAHLMAASGSNILLISAALFWAGKWLPLPRWTVLCLISALLLLYVAAAGMTASVIRAYGMAVLYFLAYGFRREYDSLSALSLVFIVNVLLAPMTLFDVGFQISYACLFGLSLYPFDWQSASRWTFGQRVQAGVFLALSGWIFSSPLAAYHFHAVPLAGGVATLLAEIPYSLLVWVGMGGWVVSSVAFGFLNPVIAPIVGIALDFVAGLARVAASPSVWTSVAPFSVWWLVVIYGMALILWRPHWRPA